MIPEVKIPCDDCYIEFRLCPLYPNACNRLKIYEGIQADRKAVIKWGDSNCPTPKEHGAKWICSVGQKDGTKIDHYIKVKCRKCDICWNEFMGSEE